MVVFFIVDLHNTCGGGGGEIMKTKMHVTTGDKRSLSHSLGTTEICLRKVSESYNFQFVATP